MPEARRQVRGSATPLVTIVLATTGSVGVAIAPISSATHKGRPRIRNASREQPSHMSGIRTPSRTPRSRQLREDRPSGSRKATPTRATSSVTREAPFRIVPSPPRPAKSKRSKTAGLIRTPASSANRGSERKQLAHGVASIGDRQRMRNTSYAIGSVANSLFSQRRGKRSSPKSISSMLHRKFHAGVRIDA